MTSSRTVLRYAHSILRACTQTHDLLCCVPYVMPISCPAMFIFSRVVLNTNWTCCVMLCRAVLTGVEQGPAEHISSFRASHAVLC